MIAENDSPAVEMIIAAIELGFKQLNEQLEQLSKMQGDNNENA